MDKYPFFTFNLLEYEDKNLEELIKFTNDSFDEDEITRNADKLKYVRILKEYLKSNYESNIDEEFFKFMFSQVYSQRVGNWNSMHEKYGQVVSEAFNQFINDEVRKKLKNALGESDDNQQVNIIEPPKKSQTDVTKDKNILFVDNDKGIVTTVEEVEAYHIVKSILRNEISLDRVIMRDTKSYYGLLFDDNNRKPIARLYFNSSQKYLATFDADKNETKHPIDKLEQIYDYSDLLISVVHNYL